MTDDSPTARSVRQRNLRLALILATVAASFFIGFLLKMTVLSHH